MKVRDRHLRAMTAFEERGTISRADLRVVRHRLTIDDGFENAGGGGTASVQATLNDEWAEANRVLSGLRPKAQRYTFGGRVRSGGTSDLAARTKLLQEYYPLSLGFAHAAATRVPGGADGVANALPSISIPDDLWSLMRFAAGLRTDHATLGPLGDWDDRDPTKLSQAIKKGDQLETYRPTDNALANLYSPLRTDAFPKDLSAWPLKDLNDEALILLTEIYARAKGPPNYLPDLACSQLGPLMERLPGNQRAVAALAALADAMGAVIDLPAPHQLPSGKVGERLSAAVARLRAEAAVRLSGSLGGTQGELGISDYDSSVEKLSPPLKMVAYSRLSDAGIKTLGRFHTGSLHIGNPLVEGDKAAPLGVKIGPQLRTQEALQAGLRFVTRVAHLQHGILDTYNGDGHMPNKLRVIADALDPTSENAALLMQACTSMGFWQRDIELGGIPLHQWPGGFAPEPLPPPSPTSPRAMTRDEVERLVATHNPLLFSIDDASLQLLQGDLHPLLMIRPDDWEQGRGNKKDQILRGLAWHEGVMTLWDRAIVAGVLKDQETLIEKYASAPEGYGKAQYNSWFDGPISSLATTAPVSVAFQRLLRRTTLLPDALVTVFGQGGQRRDVQDFCPFRYDDRRHLNILMNRRSVEMPPLASEHKADSLELLQAVARDFDALDPLRAHTPAELRQKISALLDPQRHVPFIDLLERGVEGLTQGLIERCTFETAAQQRTFAQEILAPYDHAGAAAVLAGLYTHLDGAIVAKALEARGIDPQLAAYWGTVPERMRALSSAQLAWVTEPLLELPHWPDFLGFDLRLKVLESHSPAQLTELAKGPGRSNPVAFAKALREARALCSREQATTLELFLLDRIGDGSLPPTGEDDRLWKKAQERAMATLEEKVGAYVEAPAKGRSQALDGLIEGLRTNAGTLDLPWAVETLTTRLYERDLESVKPLGDADLRRNSREELLEEVKANPLPAGTKSVQVGGVTVRYNTHPTDPAQVPDARVLQGIDLTLPEVQEAMELIALGNRVGKPVFLRGPSGIGKTRLLAVFAHLTNRPLYIVPGGDDVSEESILGRMVGGAKEHTQKSLEQQHPEQVRQLAMEFGLDSTLELPKLIEQILEVDGKARFCPGPLPKAMMNDGIFVIDEVNKMKPGVVGTLDSVFDDTGSITLPDFDRTVMKGGPGFQAYFTGNPKAYGGGNQKMSHAFLSRCVPVNLRRFSPESLDRLLQNRWSQGLSPDLRQSLVCFHEELADLADSGEIGRGSGGLAFTLRNFTDSADSFMKFRGTAASEPMLMRRELFEQYVGGLSDPDDRAMAMERLDHYFPVPPGVTPPERYEGLSLDLSNPRFVKIGDLVVERLNRPGAPGPEAMKVLTPRFLQYLYRSMKAIAAGRTPFLVGEKSAGKTVLLEMIAHVVGVPFYRKLLGRGTDVESLIGFWDRHGFSESEIPRAMGSQGKPGLLLLDEFARAPSTVRGRLYEVLDWRRQLTLLEKDGRTVVKASPDFMSAAAGNLFTRDYAEVNKVSPAEMNRMVPIFMEGADMKEMRKIAQGVARDHELGRGRGAEVVEAHEALAETMCDLHDWFVTSGAHGKLLLDEEDTDSMRQMLEALDSAIKLTHEHDQPDRPLYDRMGAGFLDAARLHYSARAVLAPQKHAVQAMAEWLSGDREDALKPILQSFEAIP